MLRDFLYISETKVDLYFPQIPKSFFKSLSKEFGVDFGVLKAGIKHESKVPENSVVERLLVVEKYLLKNEAVGTFRFPKRFVLDDCILSWHVFDGWPNSSLVYFCGSSHHEIEVVLGGSSWHLVGGKRPESASVSSSEFGVLIKTLEELQENAELTALKTAAVRRIRRNLSERGNEFQQFREFAEHRHSSRFHTRSLSITIDFDRGCFLGTPLYIERV